MTSYIQGAAIERSAAADAAAFLGLDPSVVQQAWNNQDSGAVVMLVASGWLASGKDTIAPAVLEQMGYRSTAVHQYYALPLKQEMDDMIADLRRWFFTGRFGSLTQRRRREAAQLLSERHNIPVEQAMVFCGRLLDQVRMSDVHARSRTAVMRSALQFHGTQVRRTQDPDYWVKRALGPAVKALAAGHSVFFTDGRFPNEIDTAAAMGGYTMRVEVSRATQMARLRARDGNLTITEEQLLHDSEVALDDFDRFHVRVDNNGTLEDTIAAATEAWSLYAAPSPAPVDAQAVPAMAS